MTQSRHPLPHLTKQQQNILQHIFIHRFLTINHLRIFLKHKSKPPIQALLNDLITKGYIYQIYDPKTFKASGTPAVYYISVNGVRYIRSLDDYSESELRKRYPDTTRSQAYIDHCLLMATYCTNLQTSSNKTKNYDWITPTEYALIEDPSETADFLREQQPHLFVDKEAGKESVHYAIEHFYNHPQTSRIRSRLKKLINHDLYQAGEEGPILLIICDTLADLIYVKRYACSLIGKDITKHPIVRTTTAEQVLLKGATGPIWEEVEPQVRSS